MNTPIQISIKRPRKKMLASPFRRSTSAWTLITLALACFAVSPAARAVVPAPDGGYPNFNTAEGDNALFYLTTGENNTAIGFRTLNVNTTGSYNTATGSQALYLNTTGFGNTVNGLLRSVTTPPAAKTPPSVFERSTGTQLPTTTQPPVLLRLQVIPPAAKTQPTALLRSITTQAAATILH